ncbi:hypothetical protein PO909_021427 [Leuciscus waleckii]
MSIKEGFYKIAGFPSFLSKKRNSKSSRVADKADSKDCSPAAVILCFQVAARLRYRAPPEPSPYVPPRCPTPGTPTVPLVPLVRSLRPWLVLPSPSRWLIQTIRLGYAIQFARRPPKFRAIHSTTVGAADAHVLRAEIAVLLAKDAIEKRIFECIRPQDWFAAIDLKDAYFHVPILPRHRPFLHFAFEGRAYQYKVLPFGLSLSPCVFTRVTEGALVPMREQCVRILNYLDDWLILAHSREQLYEHRDLVLRHLSQLGLQDGGPTEILSEAPGAYGSGSSSNSARAAPYETASALASRPSPEMGVLSRQSHRRAARPSAHGQTPRSCEQESPWNRCPGMLWYPQMPLPPAGVPRTMGIQCQGCGWAPNCIGTSSYIELLAVRLTLSRLKRPLQGRDVLVCMDNTATIAYINHQGGLLSRRMMQLACHLLLWSQKHLRSLRAIYVPGVLNRVTDELLRAVLLGEWRLHPRPDLWKLHVWSLDGTRRF